jgi:hypothetical protein
MSREIIREFQNSEEQTLIHFIKGVLNSKMEPSHWAWKYKENVQGPGSISILEVDGQIAGTLGLMHNNINFMGHEIRAGQSCDGGIRMDQRGKKMFLKVASHSYETARKEGFFSVFGFPSQDTYPGSYPIIMRELNWRRVFHLKYYSYRIGFQKLWGRTLDGAFKRFRGLIIALKYFANLRVQPLGTKLCTLGHLPKNLDPFLKQIRDYEVLSIWKDARYLKWRYEDHPDQPYLFHILYSGEIPLALAITRDCEEKIAICDLLHLTKNVQQSSLLLRYVLFFYRYNPAQKMEFYGQDNGFFEGAFRAAGFEMKPFSSRIFFGRVFRNSKLEKEFFMPQNWTIAYGDTDVI